MKSVIHVDVYSTKVLFPSNLFFCCHAEIYCDWCWCNSTVYSDLACIAFHSAELFPLDFLTALYSYHGYGKATFLLNNLHYHIIYIMFGS